MSECNWLNSFKMFLCQFVASCHSSLRFMYSIQHRLLHMHQYGVFLGAPSGGEGERVCVCAKRNSWVNVVNKIWADACTHMRARVFACTYILFVSVLRHMGPKRLLPERKSALFAVHFVLLREWLIIKSSAV